MTETGYHNGVNGTVGHQPASERAAGIYMPRLFLDDFRRGIARSFSYELLDQRDDPSQTDIEAAFWAAAQRLLQEAGGTGDRTADRTARRPRPPLSFPGELDYSLEGAPATTEQLLPLQKRDGSFYLVLWNRVSVWDQATRSDLDPPAVPIAIDLEQPMASRRGLRAQRSPPPRSPPSRPRPNGARPLRRR